MRARTLRDAYRPVTLASTSPGRWSTAATSACVMVSPHSTPAVADVGAGGWMDRRVFLAVGGSALTRLVWTAVNTEPARLAAALNGGQVGATLIGQVEETIPRLRQLDDRQGGGGANLGYVHAQFQAVGQLLRTADHGGQVTRRLLVALSELGHLAGWPPTRSVTGWPSVTT
ncbi:MAG: hypothetical protein ACRDSZ_12570 [Pseudonocardiaceae bacterium]